MAEPGPHEASAKIAAALARPDAYPHRPSRVEVRETHISWVFLAGEYAYKLKKPLVLPFLDYGTAARRRAMCKEEVRLNRRLAPDTYLGVRGVAVRADAVRLSSDDDPGAIDFVVEMQRYDERRTLAARIERGEVERREIIAVARLLASFHAGAERASGTTRATLSAERRFEENLHELFTAVEQRWEVDRLLALERFAHAFIVGHAQTFEERARTGCVREGHGDLRAEHVLVNGDVRVVDCVEFDRGLRELDVADDLAFLVLELAARGPRHLGELLVREYRRAGGDPGDDSLVAFYAAYRALVRAKVALLRATQNSRVTAARGHESAQARDLIGLAETFAWRARLPLLILTCGVPATGKSHLASALAREASLPHLSSDVTRKQLAGVPPSQRAPPDAYRREFSAQTYAELGRRAAKGINTSGGAVVDATFRHLSDRRAFMSAVEGVAPVVFIECRAPAAVLADRARQRERDTGRTSDADLEVVLRERASWEELEEVPAADHLVVRTDRRPEDIVADVLAWLDRRLQLPRDRTGFG